MELTMPDGNKLLVEQEFIQEIYENSGIFFNPTTKKIEIEPGPFTIVKYHNQFLRVVETKKEIELLSK